MVISVAPLAVSIEVCRGIPQFLYSVVEVVPSNKQWSPLYKSSLDNRS
jgi:hypothetical protein